MTSSRLRHARIALWTTVAALALSLVTSSTGFAQRRGRGGGGGAPRAARSNVHQSNRNLNANVNVNVDRDFHGRYDRWGHPMAGAAIAATATAIAVGTMVTALPSGCSAVDVAGVAYQRCGPTYYQPIYSGANVQYEVVNPP